MCSGRAVCFWVKIPDGGDADWHNCMHGDIDIMVQTKIGSFLCLLNNNSGYDILELSFIPGGYNDAGITHIA